MSQWQAHKSSRWAFMSRNERRHVTETISLVLNFCRKHEQLHMYWCRLVTCQISYSEWKMASPFTFLPADFNKLNTRAQSTQIHQKLTVVVEFDMFFGYFDKQNKRVLRGTPDVDFREANPNWSLDRFYTRYKPCLCRGGWSNCPILRCIEKERREAAMWSWLPSHMTITWRLHIYI